MELVSARTVLTAANGGDIIAAVGREPLTWFDTRTGVDPTEGP